MWTSGHIKILLVSSRFEAFLCQCPSTLFIKKCTDVILMVLSFAPPLVVWSQNETVLLSLVTKIGHVDKSITSSFSFEPCNWITYKKSTRYKNRRKCFHRFLFITRKGENVWICCPLEFVLYWVNILQQRTADFFLAIFCWYKMLKESNFRVYNPTSRFPLLSIKSAVANWLFSS